MKSETISKLALALSKAQAKIYGAVKEQDNLFFKSKYADLGAVYDAIRAPFAENELSATQLVDEQDNKLYLITMLLHSSGEYITSRYPLVLKDMSNPQSLKSLVTYARRASLAAIAGVAETDDDGNEASGNVVNETHFQQSKPQADAKAQKLVTEGQLKRLFAIQKQSGKSHEDVFKYMRENFKKESSSELTMSEYDNLIEFIERK